jgi:hypothetical protein
VRRLAYEAADSGLLSPELAAGIRRVKRAKQLGAGTGNWLTQDQARDLQEKADGDDLRSLRDLGMISLLVAAVGVRNQPRQNVVGQVSDQRVDRIEF